MAERELLTISEAMTRARVNRRSIYNWINAGRIDYVRTAGGAIRIFADSLFRLPDKELSLTEDRKRVTS